LQPDAVEAGRFVGSALSVSALFAGDEQPYSEEEEQCHGAVRLATLDEASTLKFVQ